MSDFSADTAFENLRDLRDDGPDFSTHEVPSTLDDTLRPPSSLERADQQRLELMEQLLTDYYAFVTYGLGNRVEDYAGFADPGVVHYVDRYGEILADWLATRHAQKTFRKVAVIVPRECVKSTLITQSAPVFVNAHLPDSALAISSATMEAKPSAVEFAGGVARHWEGRSRHALYPELWGPNKGPVWRSTKYITANRQNLPRRDPSLGVFSVQTGGTSGHFDGVWLDDPITQEQVDKFGMSWLDTVWTHYLSLGYVVRQDGILTIVATRYGESDLIGRIIRTEIEPATRARVQVGAPVGQLPDDFYANWHKYAHLAGWDVINMAAEYDNDGNRRIMFPVIWPQERIDAERLKSPGMVAAQLNNRPGEREDNPIKPHHIDRAYFDSLDEVPPQAFSWITCQVDLSLKDPAARREGRGDFTVIQLWAHHDGHVYLIWSWRGRPTPEEFDDRLLAACKWAQSGYPRSRVRLLTYDRPEGQGNAKSYTARHLEVLFAEAGMNSPRIIEIPRQGKRKEARMLATSSFWVGGLVHMLRDSPCAPEIASQMLSPTLGSHDDDADAAADVFHEDVYLRKSKKKPGGPDDVDRSNGAIPRPVAHGSFDSRGKFHYYRRGRASTRGRGGYKWR